MTILIVCIALLLLILLIAWAKFHPFLAFLIVSLLVGWRLGIPLEKLSASIKTGIGSMLGELAIIICLGAMLGKLVAETGAVQKISDSLIQLFGKKNLQWAMMLTGFIVGIPLFYNVGFVLLVPLAFGIIYRTGLNALYIALPMLAALSVTHGFLPPHPSPIALSVQLHAQPGMVLLYGIVIAIPAIIVAGPLFARTLTHIQTPPLQLFKTQQPLQKIPGTLSSYISALLPALLLILFSLIPFLTTPSSSLEHLLTFFGDPVIILLISLLFATYALGIRNNHSLKTIMNFYSDSVKDIAVILLIIAGAGALKQVLVDSGVNDTIAQYLSALPVHPLVAGWLIAAVIRVCLGSATVAGLTAAGIVAPLVANGSANPNLMVLAVGAGSLLFSHVNDSGFWMFKEYFNLSVKDTLRSWSVMETIVAVMGLIGVMVLNLFI
jgi:Gnt-I system high-affinity gluconate transporter